MKRILLVEDDALARYSINRVLTTAGYEVEEASDGVQALRKFKIMRPDLVITDIVMPEQDGIGLINALIAIDKNVRVLAISGGGERMGMDYLEMAQVLGARASIAKPFRNEILLEKVAQLTQSIPTTGS